MKIAVLGCGAIGGLFLGRLTRQLSAEVTGVAKDYQKLSLEEKGLVIKDGGKRQKIEVKASTSLQEPVDLAVFAVKSNDLAGAAKDNFDCLKEALVVSTQNGVRAGNILNEFFPKEKIVTAIVMFGATFYPPNEVACNFPGNLILGSVFGRYSGQVKAAEKILSRVFPTKTIKNIKGAKYLKLFINLNNCIPAILGKPMQEVFADLDIAELAVALNREAYEVIAKASIRLESLPAYPKERIENLAGMPSREAAALFSRIMANLSKEPLYGSILQSIKRGRPSEIDYINGEIVRLSAAAGIKAVLNQEIVRLVHEAEAGNFLTKEELLSRIKGIKKSTLLFPE